MFNFCLGQDLASHRWKHRVILLFAPETDHPTLLKQLALLTKHANEVTDRDLVFYQILPSAGLTPAAKLLSSEQAQKLYRKYSVSYDQFTFLLIGKDGTEKLRRQTLVPLPELFALIDGMPMRRAEMKRKNKP